MKNTIKTWLFQLAKKRIAKQIVFGENKLTPEYLVSRGWVSEYDEIRQKTFYFEPDLKRRDTIYIDFETSAYRVWHSSEKTFIACESSIEWFELYHLLAHGDNGHYELAGV